MLKTLINRLIKQNTKQDLLEQRWTDTEKRLKEMEGLHQSNAILNFLIPSIIIQTAKVDFQAFY